MKCAVWKSQWALEPWPMKDLKGAKGKGTLLISYAFTRSPSHLKSSALHWKSPLVAARPKMLLDYHHPTILLTISSFLIFIPPITNQNPDSTPNLKTPKNF